MEEDVQPGFGFGTLNFMSIILEGPEFQEVTLNAWPNIFSGLLTWVLFWVTLSCPHIQVLVDIAIGQYWEENNLGWKSSFCCRRRVDSTFRKEPEAGSLNLLVSPAEGYVIFNNLLVIQNMHSSVSGSFYTLAAALKSPFRVFILIIKAQSITQTYY